MIVLILTHFLWHPRYQDQFVKYLKRSIATRNAMMNESMTHLPMSTELISDNVTKNSMPPDAERNSGPVRARINTFQSQNVQMVLYNE
jgi:hypothetical protein